MTSLKSTAAALWVNADGLCGPVPNQNSQNSWAAESGRRSILSALWPGLLLSSRISSAHPLTSSKQISSQNALFRDVELSYTSGGTRMHLREFALFRDWNRNDRFFADRLIGVAQTYLASAPMSGFHDVVIPLLVPAATALRIHAATRFPSTFAAGIGIFIFALLPVRARLSQSRNFHSTGI
jgi:hypothetical protein